MWFVVKNINTTVSFCLSVVKFFGLHDLKKYNGFKDRIFSDIYWLSWFLFLVGGPVFTQGIAMLQLWGDITAMTSASCLLFTNISLGIKMITCMRWRHSIAQICDTGHEELSAEGRKEGIRIIKSCDRENYRYMCFYLSMAFTTCLCWSASAENGQLPLTAWYPYDTSTSPSYEVTYFIQSSSLIISALMNVSFDNFVAALISVVTCRLQLVALSIEAVCDSLGTPEEFMLSAEDEKTVKKRLNDCVVKHEAAMQTAAKLQICFAKPILTNFTVSMFIICVTAYQLSLELSNKNWVRIISMIAYLGCMTIEVFLFCYRGNQLSEMSSEIANAAYWCAWYRCSVPLRRTLLIIMARTYNVTRLTADGFTELSLRCFASIIKASYTFFTVLNTVDDSKK